MSDRKKLKMVSTFAAGGAEEAVPAAEPMAVPDPEVRAVAKCRQFSAAYQFAMLEEADRGERGRGDG